ncbi:MarR family winged helix-turn-helix transcriptional regulator [Micromonospora sp. CPCC 205371]|nr:MarR family winged helix-turn-helix transcriptional regulator [Micromonospora sp. CPCC 205371]
MAGVQTTEAGTLTDSLLAASRVLVGLAAQSLGQLDVEVTLVQFRALVVLAGGPQRTVDLAAVLAVAPSTVTRMCDRLVRKDLVRRYRRIEDRRATWLGLTEAGRDLVGDVMRSRRRAIGRMVRANPVADPSSAVEALDALVLAGGELPESQWWRRWRSSATPPADATTA